MPCLVGRGPGVSSAPARPLRRVVLTFLLHSATPNGKVAVHHPHLGAAQQEGWEPVQGDVSMLSVHKRITGLAAATFGKKDVLLLGTPTDYTAYDVARNSDLFFKDMPDGATAVVAGRLGGHKAPWAFAGGSCSIQGFSADGADEFWTVTGAHVLALALCDVTGPGAGELVAGLDDARIRVYAASGEVP